MKMRLFMAMDNYANRTKIIDIFSEVSSEKMPRSLGIFRGLFIFFPSYSRKALEKFRDFSE